MTTLTTRINNFSASQIVAFTNCQRLWFLQSILRIRFPDGGPRLRGKEIHTIFEHYLKTGEIKKGHELEFWRYVEWLIPFLPDPKTEKHMAIEQNIWLDTHDGTPLLNHDEPSIGIPLIGYIDLGLWGREMPEVLDLKTTSNMRYAKTPEELNQDVQLNTYARWVFGVQKDLEEVKVGHIYLKVEGPGKKPPKNVRSAKVLPVFTTITRAGNEACWQRDAATMEKMKIVALAERWEDVDPNLNHCPAYGGCDFREKCGISAKETLFQQPTKGQDMSFLDKIKNAEKTNGASAPPMAAAVPKVASAGSVKQAAVVAKNKAASQAQSAADSAKAAPAAAGGFLAGLKKPAVVVATKAPVAPPVVEDEPEFDEPEEAAAPAILSPDAAPRTPSIEESEAIRDEAQNKLEAKEAKKAVTAEKKAALAAAKGTAKRKGKHKRELTLYIGCSPTKGEDQMFTLIEDWIAPIIEDLNANVFESTQKQDYRLLGYAEEKVALTSAISARVAEGDMPSALVCMNSGIGREVATILMPLATDIVSAGK